jgi:hypothetical protein
MDGGSTYCLLRFKCEKEGMNVWEESVRGEKEEKERERREE